MFAWAATRLRRDPICCPCVGPCTSMTTAPWPCTRPQVLGKLNIPLGQLDVEHAEDETAILDEPRWNQVRGELLFNAVSVSVPPRDRNRVRASAQS